MRTEEQARELRAICSGLAICKRGGSAKDLQRRAAEELRARGFTVEMELRVPNRGDGQPGRVDLWLPRVPAAVEIDFRSARAKSLFKLRSLRALRVLVLRAPAERPGLAGFLWYAGIDAVVHLDKAGLGGFCLSGSESEKVFQDPIA